ncbi:MAG: YlmC/YmxH family sporulation protein [Clostridia bacterium]|nr:YlmC/YmxH family sporulation protein [Clostridia bacterium]
MPACNSEDFRDKEVINVCDGRRLGFVSEIEFDVCDGRITAIVVCAEGGLLGVKKGEELVVPWDKIQKIGEDIILVDGIVLPPPDHGGLRRRKGKL